MATTFCISGAVLKLAGVNVHTSLSAGAIYVSASNFIVDHWINEAENKICVLSNYDYLGDYDTLSPKTKDILSETAEAMAAAKCITYDQGGYTSLAEAQTMLNLYRDIWTLNLSILNKKDVAPDFLKNTS